MKIVSLNDVIGLFPRQPGRIFVQGAAATPLELLEQLTHSTHVESAELIHLHTSGPAPYAAPPFHGRFRVVNLFVGANMRPYLNGNEVDYLPCFLSEMGQLFRRGVRAPEVALIQVSPPDAHGFCSLGTSVDITRAAVQTAKLVVAQINPRVPRTFGDALIHSDEIDFAVEVNRPLPEHAPRPLTEVEKKIGHFVASRIENGATLQTGIGAVPDAVLAALSQHQHLGIHTEMWSDGMIPLLQAGVIDNSRKKIHAGKSVSSFMMGTQRLYDFIHNNPSILVMEAEYVNNPRVIAKNPRVTAINSAVEIDLTGQVCADSIGSQVISGVGGQIDFIRGAALSEGGKPIIALPSTTKTGQSRIVAQLNQGAGVVTTHADVHFVATEYGIVDLFGKTLKERAQALISLAHPNHREQLSAAVFQAQK